MNEVLNNGIDENTIDVQEFQNIVAPGCWVIVKYSTKKLTKHFVGNVLEHSYGRIMQRAGERAHKKREYTNRLGILWGATANKPYQML